MDTIKFYKSPSSDYISDEIFIQKDILLISIKKYCGNNFSQKVVNNNTFSLDNENGDRYILSPSGNKNYKISIWKKSIKDPSLHIFILNIINDKIYSILRYDKILKIEKRINNQ